MTDLLSKVNLESHSIVLTARGQTPSVFSRSPRPTITRAQEY